MRPVLKVRQLAIALALATYLLFSCAYLHLPGLEYDEVLFTNAAMGNVDGTFIEWQIEVAGIKVPVMLMGYIGALKAYLYAPIFAVLGTSAVTARLPVVLVGLITLYFTYKLVRLMLGDNVALVALVLLACDPSFIFTNRLDWGPVALMMALKMSSLYLLWRWLNEGNLYQLGLASFLLGLGLFDKVIFVWFIGALVVALPVCFWRELKARVSIRAATLSLGCFLVGCFPLLAYNYKFPWMTFKNQKVVTTSWARDLGYRYDLFQSTLDGSAVHRMINNEDAGYFAELFKQKGEGTLDNFFSALVRFAPLEKTFNSYALMLALVTVLLLWSRGRLEAPPRALFFLLQLTLISGFVCATAQGTGPHHVVAVHPFTHIVIATAIYGLARIAQPILLKGNVNIGRFAGVLSVVVLVLPALAVNAGYVKSFTVKGGEGRWSDAIYSLAEYARNRSDKKFLLMDWGFSTQLLLLSQGKIKKEEAFISIADHQNEEEKIAAMYPYLRGTGGLLVFHVPGAETYPLFDTFKLALAKYGLEGRLVQAFYQRDGKPVYLVYEVSHPQIDSYIESGNFFYLREAEEWDAKSGGDTDGKAAASQAKALGNFWGSDSSDFVVYRFSVPRRISNSYLHLRYAFQLPGPQRYCFFLDNTLVDVVALESTGGFGYIESEWKMCSVKIGTLSPGTHELKIQPARDGQVMNIDYFYFSEGELWLKTELSATAKSEDGPAGFYGGEIAGYLNRPEVRLKASSSEVSAGKSWLTLRAVNFSASAIDVLYSIDGKTMPAVYGWPLDASHSTTVFVDANTPRGMYHYKAIRDSREASPSRWIRVDVYVRVK